MNTDEIDPEDFVCGEAFDHDEVITYDGPDCKQWMCRRCGAEGWIDPETDST